MTSPCAKGIMTPLSSFYHSYISSTMVAYVLSGTHIWSTSVEFMPVCNPTGVPFSFPYLVMQSIFSTGHGSSWPV